MDVARQRDVDALWGVMGSTQRNASAAMARQTMIAVGSTGLVILVGGTQQVDIVWPEPFTLPYKVDMIPTGLLGKATMGLVNQDENGVSILVTAGLLVAAGSQFLCLGRS